MECPDCACALKAVYPDDDNPLSDVLYWLCLQCGSEWSYDDLFDPYERE